MALPGPSTMRRIVMTETGFARPTKRVTLMAYQYSWRTVHAICWDRPGSSSNERRGFASTSIARGLMPSFNWNQRKAPISEEIGGSHKEGHDSSFVEELPSIYPETPVNAVVVDTTTPAAASVSEVVQHYIKGFDGSLISSGSLDLSGISTGLHIHPIMRMQSMMLNFHESFPLLDHGLPWYTLIPTLTVFLRIGLFYFQVKAQRNNAKMAVIQPELLKSMNRLKEAKKRGDPISAQQAQFESQDLMKSHGVNPIRGIIFPIAQGATFMTAFFAIRGLANAGIPSLTTEGFGWVRDLTAADPYMILPFASTLLTFAMIESSFRANKSVPTASSTNLKYIFRAVCVFTPFVVMNFPAAVLVFWVSNNTISLAQTLILQQKPVRRFFGIPEPPRKLQPGEPGYMKEPSFMESFRTMKDSAREMSREAREKAEKETQRREITKLYEKEAEEQRRQRLLNPSSMSVFESQPSPHAPITEPQEKTPASVPSNDPAASRTRQLPTFDKDLLERLRKAGYDIPK